MRNNRRRKTKTNPHKSNVKDHPLHLGLFFSKDINIGPFYGSLKKLLGHNICLTIYLRPKIHNGSVHQIVSFKGKGGSNLTMSHLSNINNYSSRIETIFRILISK